MEANPPLPGMNHSLTYNITIPWRTLISLDLLACRHPRTALTSDPLIWSSRWLKRDIRFFQWSSSARGPMSSASRRICSDSANTFKHQHHHLSTHRFKSFLNTMPILNYSHNYSYYNYSGTSSLFLLHKINFTANIFHCILNIRFIFS